METEKEDQLKTIKKLIEEKLNLLKYNIDKKKDRLVKELWELSKEKFKLESELNSKLKKYEGIIFTIGFSAEPIILTILANNPKCAYFIYTKESEKILDRIIEESNLKPSCYKRELIPRNSAAESYLLVKKGLQFLEKDKKIQRKKIGLDPTGGTKIMSVGCGIAATIFNLDLLYVNNLKYDPESRKPVSGSEQLLNIPNPFDIYQDDKLIEGLKYLENLDFNTAKVIFNQIKLSSSDPLLPELLVFISNSLYLWDMIDYSNALKSIIKSKDLMVKLEKKLSKIKNKLENYLDSWETYLKSINDVIQEDKTEIEKITPLLIYDIKFNADREFYKENFNNAALKYYRTIEMINQYILLNDYQIDTQNPNYKNVNDNVRQYLLKMNSDADKNIERIILEYYSKIWKNIYQNLFPDKIYNEKETLPYKLSLLDGTILRSIFGDNSIDKDFILHLFQAIENRNKSIFAHGITSINKRNCETLKKISEKMLNQIDISNELKSSVFDQNKLKEIKILIQNII